MLLMQSQIELYEEMSELSATMVEAARAHDWDRLVTLESAVNRLRNTLARTASDNDGLHFTEIERKRGLIQRILSDDAEIRRYTEPWMEHVRQFLGSHSRRRDVQKAYAAGAGDSSAGSFGT